ncbi:MAG: TusE/DsrC/DsvC family sulfur relay protein [Nitrospirae bacterium]|nr:TusE/DsrC/DsvC family sulfur relay protein [Nitrospirota bacterium]
MPVIEYGGVKIKLDEEGYLLNFDDWSEKTACGLAEHEGIEELSKDRLEIIKFMREYYTKFKAFPILGAVCKNVHQPKDCVNEDFIDPVKAWKIAGLPKPSEEVISYLKR